MKQLVYTALIFAVGLSTGYFSVHLIPKPDSVLKVIQSSEPSVTRSSFVQSPSPKNKTLGYSAGRQIEGALVGTAQESAGFQDIPEPLKQLNLTGELIQKINETYPKECQGWVQSTISSPMDNFLPNPESSGDFQIMNQKQISMITNHGGCDLPSSILKEKETAAIRACQIGNNSSQTVSFQAGVFTCLHAVDDFRQAMRLYALKDTPVSAIQDPETIKMIIGIGSDSIYPYWNGPNSVSSLLYEFPEGSSVLKDQMYDSMLKRLLELNPKDHGTQSFLLENAFARFNKRNASSEEKSLALVEIKSRAQVVSKGITNEIGKANLNIAIAAVTDDTKLMREAAQKLLANQGRDTDVFSLQAAKYYLARAAYLDGNLKEAKKYLYESKKDSEFSSFSEFGFAIDRAIAMLNSSDPHGEFPTFQEGQHTYDEAFRTTASDPSGVGFDAPRESPPVESFTELMAKFRTEK